MAFNAQKNIETRRRNEDNYRRMEAITAATQRTMMINNFETTTAARIDKRSMQEAYQRMERDNEGILMFRRRNLAALYNNEMDQWRSEALAKTETQEDRKARIMERAYALRDARESERLAFVKACYDQQWRDACDDARSLDSQALTELMGRERMAQIQEKIKRKQQLSAAENLFVEDWKQEIAKIEERERLKEEARRKADMDMEAGLKQQMEYNYLKKEEHFQRTRKEDEEEISRIRGAIQEEDETQRLRLERNRHRGKEVREFNEQFKEYTAEQDRIKRQQDAILLDYALRKEREANEAEEAKRIANRDAAIQYRRYLEEQMVKEAEDTAFMDEVCKREEERVWKARDDALQAREDARNSLLQMVDQGRQEQIRLKREALEQERQEGRVFAERFIEESKEGIEKDQSAMEMRRAKSKDNQLLLAQQIALRRHKEELERQESYLQDKHMKHMERLHQQRLADQAGSVRITFPIKGTQWYT